jgi:hypothetical protein
MITAEEFCNNNFAKQIISEDIYASKDGIILSHKMFANLHLDSAIKEFANYLFSSHIDGTTPMNYEEWLRHYKIRNKLKWK